MLVLVPLVTLSQFTLTHCLLVALEQVVMNLLNFDELFLTLHNCCLSSAIYPFTDSPEVKANIDGNTSLVDIF